jgi:glycosyltransferase involved in cell wall biosynthesis
MLAEAFESVLAQTFTDYEIIVVSNGENAEMRGRSRYVAAGWTYVALDRGNVSIARNAGVAMAKGEWIAFLDDDDVWAAASRGMVEAKGNQQPSLGLPSVLRSRAQICDRCGLRF